MQSLQEQLYGLELSVNMIDTFCKNAFSGTIIEHLLPFCKKNYGSSLGFFPPHRQNPKAVYFLVKNKRVVYIGCTQRRDRMFAHRKNKRFDSVYYTFFENNDGWDVEQRLISTFKTKYNKCWYAKKLKNKQK